MARTTRFLFVAIVLSTLLAAPFRAVASVRCQQVLAKEGPYSAPKEALTPATLHNSRLLYARPEFLKDLRFKPTVDIAEFVGISNKRGVKIGTEVAPELGLEDLAIHLLNANPGLVQSSALAKSGSVLEIRVRAAAHHELYPTFTALITAIGSDGAEVTIVFNFRSNGQVAFLDRTYAFHQEFQRTKFRLVYRLPGKSEYESVDQTEAILAELPSRVTLARTMNRTEADLWRSGKSELINPTRSHKGIHFALNEYAMPSANAADLAMYTILMDRSLLTELFHRDLLTINTYTSENSDSKFGMNSKAQTPFGLEIEIVVGQAGKKLIATAMEKLNYSRVGIPYLGVDR